MTAHRQLAARARTAPGRQDLARGRCALRWLATLALLLTLVQPGGRAAAGTPEATVAPQAGIVPGSAPPRAPAPAPDLPAATAVVVGSKRFTESYVLGELLAEAARRAGAPAEHRPGLGTTGIVFAALRSGAIDVYAEYTGTIARDILGLRDAGGAPPALDELNRALAPLGVRAAVPLGFDNSYAIAMPRAQAQRLGIERITDLAAHPTLRLGLTPEFMALPAGWPGLSRAYGLPQAPVGIEHGLAYRALADGRLDAKEVYTTDAQIIRLDLTVLRDDLGFFPRYDAVLLHRADLPQRLPRAWAAMQALQGRLDTGTMRRLNAQVEIDGRSFAQAARGFFEPGAANTAQQAGAAAPGAPGAAAASTGSAGPIGSLGSSAPSRPAGSIGSPGMPTSTGPPEPAAPPDSLASPGRRSLREALLGQDLGALAAEHLLLVGVSLAAAIAVGVPLGVVAQRRPAAGAWILGTVGVVQTVPSLALLALLIALLERIGTVPALLALSLYALLPIVRNTAAGLDSVGRGLRDAARAIGLRPLQALRRVELPLALPMMLAGIKIAAVVNVGTATIAAFVGAGGFGTRIVQGLALNDTTLLLAGALPSALLALGVQALFSAVERALVPAASRARG